MKNKLVYLVLFGIFVSACGEQQAEPPIVDPGQPILITPGPTQTPPFDDDRDDGRQLVRANIFINHIGLTIMESFPIQIALNVEGELPTPCNKFVADVSPPNQDNEIHVDVYTLIDPAESCIAMIQPFSSNVPVPLEGFEDGAYTIWVNGEQVGEFNYPGG